MGGKSDKGKLRLATSVGQDQDGPHSQGQDDPARVSRSLYDWVYHGINPSDDRAHIMVEDVVFGPTERQNVSVLRELPEPAYGGFGWGYNGSGPLWAAAAILADALSLGDPASCGLDPAAPARDGTLIALRGDFVWDVLSQLCMEWRLRRGAVLRWVRGWYAEHGITDLPRAAVQLPPLSPYGRSS